MKFFILISVLLSVAFVSCQDEINCHCSVVIRGDNKIFVRYRSSAMSHVNDCSDIDGCSAKCVKMFDEATNGGDLNSKPDELHGYTVGDFGCRLLAMDVDEGVASVFSKLCDHDSVLTTFKFKSNFCCRNKKHSDNCAA